MTMLGACGRQGTGPDLDAVVGQDVDEESVAEGAEDTAAERALELQTEAANDRLFAESVQRGEFNPDYQPGETSTLSTAATVVVVAAGDIATSGSGDSQTAKLVEAIPGTVLTLGDNAYSNGSASNFRDYYEPTWGKFKSRTRPSPGNHDYNTSGASAYYSYFGSNAGPSGRGYYSFNVGDWHIVSLNSNISMSAGSTQEKWLRADLAANTKPGTLAYWHHPRFSSGDHGSSTKSKPIWQALYDYNAEIVLVGHDHNYERFAPMTAGGTKNTTRGLRQFVVGTGGTSLRSMDSRISNSEARSSSTKGVLKLTLGATSYSWEFVPVAGKTYTDKGTAAVH